MLSAKKFKEAINTYKRKPTSFVLFLLVVISAIFTVSILITIIAFIMIKGIPNITWEFLTAEYKSSNYSAFSSIITTLYMIIISLAISSPLGIFCAVYLIEYAKKDNKAVKIVRIATETLAGIPSIIYGLFGMMFFVTFLKWQYSLLAGACTLSIMILPLIIRATEEALKGVPDTFREGSYGLGASKLRTVFKIVVPYAMPGIFAGIILSIGRIVGETAALIFTAGAVARIPTSVFDSSRTLALHMYLVQGIGLPEAVAKTYATGVILIITVLFVNLFATYMARKVRR